MVRLFRLTGVEFGCGPLVLEWSMPLWDSIAYPLCVCRSHERVRGWRCWDESPGKLESESNLGHRLTLLEKT